MRVFRMTLEFEHYWVSADRTVEQHHQDIVDACRAFDTLRETSPSEWLDVTDEAQLLLSELDDCARVARWIARWLIENRSYHPWEEDARTSIRAAFDKARG